MAHAVLVIRIEFHHVEATILPSHHDWLVEVAQHEHLLLRLLILWFSLQLARFIVVIGEDTHEVVLEHFELRIGQSRGYHRGLHRRLQTI